MSKHDKKPTNKDICALCCNGFINCTKTTIKDIKECGTHMVLKERYGDMTVDELIERGARNNDHTRNV